MEIFLYTVDKNSKMDWQNSKNVKLIFFDSKKILP